jgi:hypothetical protein
LASCSEGLLTCRRLWWRNWRNEENREIRYMNVLVKRLRELCTDKQEPEEFKGEKWWDRRNLPPNMQPDELMRDASNPGSSRGINACSLQATAEWAWVRPTDAGVTADALC